MIEYVAIATLVVATIFYRWRAKHWKARYFSERPNFWQWLESVEAVNKPKERRHLAVNEWPQDIE